MENVKKTVAEFKGKMSIKIRRQKILNIVEKNFKRRKLLRKYTVKMLYG